MMCNGSAFHTMLDCFFRLSLSLFLHHFFYVRTPAPQLATVSLQSIIMIIICYLNVKGFVFI